MKRALITGITGQSGSYLAESLLSKNYEVHGMMRRTSNFNTQRIDHFFDNPNLHIHYGDITDANSLGKVLQSSNPDHVYNLACQSHVRISFDQPIYTTDTVYLGTLRLIETVKNFNKNIRFYQASSSEQFGNSPPPQNEKTPFNPMSPYAIGKVAAHNLCCLYRQAYGMFICCGILFNHESPRRGHTFVTKKITKGIANIVAGKQKKIHLGNINAKRDWGYAPEFVEAMVMMLEHNEPDDYVIATGESKTVGEFLEYAFGLVNLSWEKYIEIDKRYYRPTEVDALSGDASKANKVLGWKPKTTFHQLVRIMVEYDLHDAGIDVKLAE